METQAQIRKTQASIVKNQHLEEITNFYDEATADYAFWSKNLNMHYGYMRSPLQFFDRESMLEQMNAEVFTRLQLPPNPKVIDSGCGTGATARAFCRQNPTGTVIGLNIVASHLTLGKELNRDKSDPRRIELIHCDYHEAPLPSALADGLYAMESVCHSQNKAKWIRESARLLKPGARMVITDCFLQNPSRPMRRISRWAYNIFRKCWSVPHLAEINLFKTMLQDEGYKDIQIENARW